MDATEARAAAIRAANDHAKHYGKPEMEPCGPFPYGPDPELGCFAHVHEAIERAQLHAAIEAVERVKVRLCRSFRGKPCVLFNGGDTICGNCYEIQQELAALQEQLAALGGEG